jgi:hypothetical protein
MPRGNPGDAFSGSPPLASLGVPHGSQNPGTRHPASHDRSGQGRSSWTSHRTIVADERRAWPERRGCACTSRRPMRRWRGRTRIRSTDPWNRRGEPVPAWLVAPPRTPAAAEPPVVLGGAPRAARRLLGLAEARGGAARPPRALLRGMRSAVDPRRTYLCPAVGPSLPGNEAAGRRHGPAPAWLMAHRRSPRSNGARQAFGRRLRGRPACHRGGRPASGRPARARRGAGVGDARTAAA